MMSGVAGASVLGIDLAARDKKTYACMLTSRDGALDAELFESCSDETLLGLARGCRKVAIDAPFGWPDEFVDALNAHRGSEAWPAPDDGSPPEVFRASLSFRATDRVVMHTRRPLSVSTDKLGVTAMRCAFLLHRWSTGQRIDRTGRGKFVEVYPAGALVRWGLDGSGYKGADKRALGALLRKLLNQLPALRLSKDDRRTCASSDDAFDALAASLVARAALLRLTDPPPSKYHDQAAREGWIHLPLRGSLPFLAREKPALTADPAAALGDALRASGFGLTHTGYATRFDDAVLTHFSEETKEAIREDLSGKGGSELAPRRGGQPKFHAAHSSAALAANTFAPFLHSDDAVPLGRGSFAGEVKLEVKCPSGLRGTPPTLDCLVDGPRKVLAVESKCVETFSRHTATFSDAYGAAFADADPGWRREYERLVEDPQRYRYLDATQLVKHYLGLRKRYPNRAVTLAYIYWEPANAEDVAACRIHAAEVAEFRRQVGDADVRLVAMPYSALWDQWSSAKRPPWLAGHAAALRRRYEVRI